MTLVVLPILALGGDMKLPAPTYSGRFPKGYSGLAVLDTSRTPYFLVDTRDRTVAYALQSGKYVSRYNLPRLGTAFTRNDSLRPCGFSLAGDVDEDGIDEFVIAVNRTVRKYKMLEGTLALTAVASIRSHPDSSRMWMTDGCIGDVNNDGRNEVLIAATGSRPPACGGDSASPVILFVCSWDKDSLVQLWNDRGALKLGLPSNDLPSEEMDAIADPRNTGANRLILLEVTGDDVHPAVFREVIWGDGELTDDGFFQLRDGLLQQDRWNRDTYHAATGCRFAQVRGRTATLADVEHTRCVSQEEFFVFSGDSAIQHCVLWEGPCTAFLADLDGKGMGIVRVPNPDEDESRFVFYRL